MHHEPIVTGKWMTGWSVVFLLCMAVGAVAFVARFALGLGATTNLSDTYPWGLWIVFDLIWIALAAGAYVTAGIVYLFGGERYHGIARSAVLMGFLSYSFVVVTLIADLGLPWHAWQIVLQRPDHSAMFEVSWCVGLYVSVLGLELAPVLFDRFGLDKLRELWSRLTPVYIVGALTFFVYLMSHSFYWAAAALVVFSALAIILPPYKGGVPILMIIAAVVFSTMHQSSLGSLFLLMPDKLNPLWWSPIMPLYFFLSSIVGGLATVMLVVALADRAFGRRQQRDVLSGLGRILAGVLAVYLVVRLADVFWRGYGAQAFANYLFIVEVGLCGLIPVGLLSLASVRNKLSVLLLTTCLVVGGVIFNRLSVVILGMTMPGPIPGIAPQSYMPTFIESMLCISLVAAAFFFFKLGAKLLPILPREELDSARGN
ncbi:MAG: NrfD/PsrC family molybdoenzyme membrane anchor subunit [Planctomycetota bacterium]